MKKAAILTTMIIILTAAIGISYILYRNGLLTKAQREEKQEAEERVQELMIPGQEEEADDRSESFAKTIEEKTGIPVNYLGNLGGETSREHGHDTFQESFKPGEEKSMALVYVAPDGALSDQDMYIEIDQSGVALPEEEYDIKRYVILNENNGGTNI